jgi:hypothetical protein
VLRELRSLRPTSSAVAPAIGDPREIDALAATQDSLAELAPERVSQPVATPASAPAVVSSSAAMMSAPPRSAPALAYQTQELAVERPSVAVTPPPSRPLPLGVIAIGVVIAAVAAIAIVWATSGSPDPVEPAVTAESEPEPRREEPALPAGMDTPPPLEDPIEDPEPTVMLTETAMTARTIEATRRVTMIDATRVDAPMLEEAVSMTIDTPVVTMEEPVDPSMDAPDLLPINPGTRNTP